MGLGRSLPHEEERNLPPRTPGFPQEKPPSGQWCGDHEYGPQACKGIMTCKEGQPSWLEERFPTTRKAPSQLGGKENEQADRED